MSIRCILRGDNRRQGLLANRRGLRALVVATAIVPALIAAGCGSNLTKAQLAAANGALEVRATSGNNLVPGSAAASAPGASSSGPLGATTPGVVSGSSQASSVVQGASGAVVSGGSAQNGSGPSVSVAGPVAAGCSAAAGANKSVINLGSFGDASGVLGAVSGPAPPAIRAWTKYINANGGLCGHPVNVIVADDGGDPARALSIAQQMVEQNHVIAIFNEFSFGELDGALPYLKSKGIPVIGSIGAALSTDHSADAFNPMVGADLGQAWGFLLSLVAQTNLTKLAVLYCREAATCTQQVNSFKALLPYKGLNIVYSAQVSLVQPDYTAELLDAKNAGAQVVVSLVDSASLIRMAQDAHRQGWNPQFSGTYNLEIDATLVGAKDLNGLILAAREAPYSTSAKLANYRQAMAQYEPGQSLGDVGAGAFVLGDLLQKLAPLLGDNPTPASMTAAMYSLHGESLDGLLPGVTFPHSDDHTHVNDCVVPIRLINGQFVSPGGADAFACAPTWAKGT
jgi:branched-chain amino acid transport system substrate-binding protein